MPEEEEEFQGSGFSVDVPILFDKSTHKDYAKHGFKMLWGNWPKLFFGPKMTVLEYKHLTLTIHRLTGEAWATIFIFPFIMLHESLHFMIAYFTDSEGLITLIPGIVDLMYLPLALVIVMHPLGNLWIPGLITVMILTLAWELLLLANLSADFQYLRVFRKAGRQRFH